MSRLVHRNYGDLAKPSWPRQYSARIEHEGIGFYFPLGTDVRVLAARKAAGIHAHAVKHGWPATFQRYPREITFSIFWRRHPLVCTYTTLYTENGKARRRTSPPNDRNARRVLLIEPEPDIRASLEEWLARTPGCVCAASFAHTRDALRSPEMRRASLCLFNQHIPGLSDVEFTRRALTLSPQLPVYSFGIYEQSDDIFISISGVTEGYYLRRRPPPKMLDPIHAAWREGASAGEELEQGVTRYFQGLFVRDGEAGVPSDIATLTSREHEVLHCLCKGHSDKLIADALSISPSTVHTHLKRIFEKLAVHTRTEAVMKLLQK
jgi:DNA-binding NarL/FixJ family response regulator